MTDLILVDEKNIEHVDIGSMVLRSGTKEKGIIKAINIPTEKEPDGSVEILTDKTKISRRDNPAVYSLIWIDGSQLENINLIKQRGYSVDKKEDSEVKFNLSRSMYVKEITNTVVYSLPEEKELLQKIMEAKKNKDYPKYIELRNLLVEHNMKMVLKIALKYGTIIHARGLDIDDMLSEGAMGLFTAIENWDASKTSESTTFVNYAGYQIERNIKKALLRQGSVITAPLHINDDYLKIKAVMDYNNDSESRVLSPDQLSNLTGLSKKRIEIVLDYIENHKNMLSINDTASTDPEDDTDATYEELIIDLDSDDPEQYTLNQERKELIYKMISELPTKQLQQTVLLRYGLDESGDTHTYQEIGNILGVTKQRVAMIDKQAIDMLRQSSSLEILRSLL